MLKTFMTKNFPGIWKFFTDFFEAMGMGNKSHSLRKWLAVGFFWLSSVVTLRYTTSDNLVAVLAILTGMITALIITYTVGNHHEKKLNSTSNGTEAGN